jgi:hypothetical protein
MRLDFEAIGFEFAGVNCDSRLSRFINREAIRAISFQVSTVNFIFQIAIKLAQRGIKGEKLNSSISISRKQLNFLDMDLSNINHNLV